MSSLSKRYKDSRERLGLSQEDVAELVGMTSAAIGKIERGLTENPRGLATHAKVLGVGEAWLKFGETEVIEVRAEKYSDQYLTISHNLKRLEAQGKLKGTALQLISLAVSLALEKEAQKKLTPE